jgi:hypothetical protein
MLLPDKGPRTVNKLIEDAIQQIRNLRDASSMGNHSEGGLKRRKETDGTPSVSPGPSEPDHALDDTTVTSGILWSGCLGAALLDGGEDCGIKNANPAFVSLLGVPLDSLIGKSLLSLVHTEDHAAIAALLACTADACNNVARVRIAARDTPQPCECKLQIIPITSSKNAPPPTSGASTDKPEKMALLYALQTQDMQESAAPGDSKHFMHHGHMNHMKQSSFESLHQGIAGSLKPWPSNHKFKCSPVMTHQEEKPHSPKANNKLVGDIKPLQQFKCNGHNDRTRSECLPQAQAQTQAQTQNASVSPNFLGADDAKVGQALPTAWPRSVSQSDSTAEVLAMGLSLLMRQSAQHVGQASERVAQSTCVQPTTHACVRSCSSRGGSHSYAHDHIGDRTNTMMVVKDMNAMTEGSKEHLTRNMTSVAPEAQARNMHETHSASTKPSSVIRTQDDHHVRSAGASNAIICTSPPHANNIAGRARHVDPALDAPCDSRVVSGTRDSSQHQWHHADPLNNPNHHMLNIKAQPQQQQQQQAAHYVQQECKFSPHIKAMSHQRQLPGAACHTDMSHLLPHESGLSQHHGNTLATAQQQFHTHFHSRDEYYALKLEPHNEDHSHSLPFFPRGEGTQYHDMHRTQHRNQTLHHETSREINSVFSSEWQLPPSSYSRTPFQQQQPLHQQRFTHTRDLAPRTEPTPELDNVYPDHIWCTHNSATCRDPLCNICLPHATIATPVRRPDLERAAQVLIDKMQSATSIYVNSEPSRKHARSDKTHSKVSHSHKSHCHSHTAHTSHSHSHHTHGSHSHSHSHSIHNPHRHNTHSHSQNAHSHSHSHNTHSHSHNTHSHSHSQTAHNNAHSHSHNTHATNMNFMHNTNRPAPSNNIVHNIGKPASQVHRETAVHTNVHLHTNVHMHAPTHSNLQDRNLGRNLFVSESGLRPAADNGMACQSTCRDLSQNLSVRVKGMSYVCVYIYICIYIHVCMYESLVCCLMLAWICLFVS